jgi:DNA modification methylase
LSEDLSLAALVADPHNRRKHNARNLAMVAESLAAVGAARSIVIDEDNVILAGNGVTSAAAAAGIERVRVIEADGDELVAVRRRNLTPEQKRALAMYDNRAGELAEWHVEQLSADRAAGLDLKPWFSAEELAAIGTHKRGRVEADEVPSVRPTTITRGDVFALGDHRLMCGDATRVEEVGRALDGRRADLVFTDPPYGVNVTSAGGDAIDGDISFTAIPLMFDVLDKVLAEGAWIYICGGQSNMPLYGRMFERYFRRLPQVLVWDKGSVSVMRPNGYHSCFEFIYYAFREGGGARWFGARTGDDADDIIRCGAPSAAVRVHPTEKPVEVPARAIRNSCPIDGLVLDPFGGSGSTLIAAHTMGRASVLVELAPHYCQVIVDRWEAFTGGRAVKQ